MKIEVEMLAFEDGKIRVVEIPADEAKGASREDLLDLAFKYGQNDFQPQPICSVSVGDVIHLDGMSFRVEPCGFAEIGEDGEAMAVAVVEPDTDERVKCATCGETYALGAPRCPDNACGRQERTLCQACGCDEIECCEVATGIFVQDGHTFDACGEHRKKAY